MQVASCNKCERHTQLALYANLHISNRVSPATKKERWTRSFFVAGETRFEHATNGFGDHYSTVEPLP